MARARLLKPGFFANEELADLPPFARLAYAGLWTIADRKGRLEDRPKRIKADIFPYDNMPIEKHLASLEERGFIKRYTVDSQKLIWLPTFHLHQRPHPNEPESKLPAHPDDENANELNVTSASDISEPLENQSQTIADGGLSESKGSPNGDPKAIRNHERSGGLLGSGSGSGIGSPLDPVAETETETETEAVAVAVIEEDCRRLCREVFGSTSPIEKKVSTAIARYGPECVQHSVNEAVISGGRGWKYAEEIMQRHEQQGHDEPGTTRFEKVAGRSRY